MAIKRISPYLPCPPGKAEAAIALYKKALGAEVALLLRYSDGPAEMKFPPEMANLIMHAELRVGDEAFMVTDAVQGCPTGDPGQIVLDFDDAAQMAQTFDALAEGGTVVMPIEDAFWGAKFGVLHDAFGVRWSFNCETKG